MSENLQDMIQEFLRLREVVMDTEDGSELIRFGELRNKLFEELNVMMDVQVICVTIPLDIYEDNDTLQDVLVSLVEELGAISKRIRIDEFEDIALVEATDIGDDEVE